MLALVLKDEVSDKTVAPSDARAVRRRRRGAGRRAGGAVVVLAGRSTRKFVAAQSEKFSRKQRQSCGQRRLAAAGRGGAVVSGASMINTGAAAWVLNPQRACGLWSMPMPSRKLFQKFHGEQHLAAIEANPQTLRILLPSSPLPTRRTGADHLSRARS